MRCPDFMPVVVVSTVLAIITPATAVLVGLAHLEDGVVVPCLTVSLVHPQELLELGIVFVFEQQGVNQGLFLFLSLLLALSLRFRLTLFLCLLQLVGLK